MIPEVIDIADYQATYSASVEHPELFWARQAERYISWFKPWSSVLHGSFETADVAWFKHASLNASYNCLDRHLPHRAHKPAVIWEGNSPGEQSILTYAELHQKVSKFSNVLKAYGLKKGDRVCIYLPMIPEAVVAMLACARLGLIHSVVFAGFSHEALKMRILDSDCRLVITADQTYRGEKWIDLKKQVDQALLECPAVERTIVVQRGSGAVEWVSERDVWYHEAMVNAPSECPCEPVDAGDPLFILYTSGSTGKPKGVVHATGGYLVYVAATFHDYFDYQETDIFWCTADIGWITGHSYTIYGPLLNGATTLLFEGVPHYPTYARYWEIIDKYQVSIFYTAPTALRAIRREGDALVNTTSRQSLRILGSVGEPINPEVWRWYHDVVGQGRCPIVNTWWQTETGGILMSAFPKIQDLIPGGAGVPYFGIHPSVVNDEGQRLSGNHVTGQLVIDKPWPGIMQTIYGDHARFVSSYLSVVPGCYYTGDGVYRDEAGHLWITGRNDDVIKVSGHRLGSEELESALVSYPAVSEAAVIGKPDCIKGESIVAFITLKATIEPDDALKQSLIQHVRHMIGPVATIDEVYWAPQLPKTRSGKIMRRILRKIASREWSDLGDVSTLADPTVLEVLIHDVNAIAIS
jgi:acetyl-CoA synthetase